MIHLEIGEPDFDHPRPHPPGRVRRPGSGLHPLRPCHRPAGTARGAGRTTSARSAASRSTRPTWSSPPAPSRSCSTRSWPSCEPGDQVIYPNPGFPIYESMINFIGGEAVPLQLSEQREFRFDIDELARADLQPHPDDHHQQPAQPHRRRAHRGDLSASPTWRVEHDIVVLADEIYSDIIYEGRAPHASCKFPGMMERTILLDGFSKTYAMTGWRLGYGLFPAPLIPHISRLIINSVSCTSTFSQKRRRRRDDRPDRRGRRRWSPEFAPPPRTDHRRAEQDPRPELRLSRRAPSTPSPTSPAPAWTAGPTPTTC